MNITGTVQPRARSRFEPENREYRVMATGPHNFSNLSFETASRARNPVEKNGTAQDRQRESKDGPLNEKERPVMQKKVQGKQECDKNLTSASLELPGIPVNVMNIKPGKEKIQPGAVIIKKTGQDMNNTIRQVEEARVSGINTVFGSTENYIEPGTAAGSDLPPLQKDESRRTFSGEPGSVFSKKPAGRLGEKTRNSSEIINMVQPDRTNTQKNDSGSYGLLEVPVRLVQQQQGLPGGTLFKESVSKTEPVINVTIGRIDVRAVKPPVTPPLPRRKTTAKPLLSLDDFLKQRNR